MGSPQPVIIGAPLKEFPGGSFNALIADYFARRGARGKDHGGKWSSTASLLPVRVKNNSGAAREPGHILGIDGVILTLTEDAGQVYRDPAVKGIVPTTAAHANKFVVCRDHIAVGGIGPAWIAGCGWAKVDVTSASHTHAKVKNSTASNLESGTEGALLLFKEKQSQSGSEALGVQWCLILVGSGGGSGKKTALLQATASIAAGSGTPRSPGTSTSYDLIKGDDLAGAAIENWSTVAIAADTYLVVLEIDGDMVIVAAFC